MAPRGDSSVFELLDVRHLGARLKSGLAFPIQVGFLALLVMLAAGAFLGYHHTRRLHLHQELVAHTHEVIGHVGSILRQLLEAETGVRGYVGTGVDSSLDAYVLAGPGIQSDLAALQNLAAVTPTEVPLIQALKERASRRMEHFDRVVELARGGNTPGAIELLLDGRGQHWMREVRQVAEQIEANQTSLLRRRSEEASTSYWTAQITGITLGVVGCTLVLLVYRLVRDFDNLRDRAMRDSAAAHERFRVTLGSIGDAVLVTDAQGRLTFCNQAGGPMLGISSESLGRPLGELLAFRAGSRGETTWDFLQEARAGTGIARTPRETLLELPDGSTRPVDATASAIVDGSGASQGAVLVVRDVSDRREKELELARLHERFRSLVLAVSQVVWTMDPDGSVLEDSPSWRRLTGATLEQFLGRGWLQTLHPEDRERVESALRGAIAARRQFRCEYRLRLSEGAYHWMNASAVPVLDPDGTVREWVGMSYDIQTQKEAEEAERDVQRRKDEFIAVLGHELRNPLATIGNSVELLKQGVGEDGGRALAMADRQLRHMTRLIDDLLDVARIRTGRLELQLGRIDLRDVLRQAVEAASSAKGVERGRIQVDLAPTPLWVDGDFVRLSQVVSNLLGNALKYSGPGDAIRVVARTEDARTGDARTGDARTGDAGPGHASTREARHVVRIRDAGQGIPAELLPRVWDLFLRGDAANERFAGGLGIGLTLVKSLVERHGGSVEAHSDGPGKGSEFLFRLPTSQPPAPASSPATARPALEGTRPLRVLVIDDDQDSAASLSMLIRRGGHDVREVHSAPAGLVACAEQRPELVLCDIRMQGMSGLEFARLVRERVEGESVFLVALTGFGTEADRQATSRVGFHRHLVKPVALDALAALLTEAAERGAIAKRSAD